MGNTVRNSRHELLDFLCREGTGYIEKMFDQVHSLGCRSLHKPIESLASILDPLNCSMSFDHRTLLQPDQGRCKGDSSPGFRTWIIGYPLDSGIGG